MDVKTPLLSIMICTGIIYWFYCNMKLEIDYDRHPHLIDPKTGAKLKPRDLIDLKKIIDYPNEYIDSTSAQRRLYDLIYYTNLENPFVIDNNYGNKRDLELSGWPVSNLTLCGIQLNWIADRLTEHRRDLTFMKGRLGYELTSLIDSLGQPEQGVYSGVISWLGSYKLCKKVTLNNETIKTRYCQGRMRAKWWPQNETISPSAAIRIGLCLPETCDSRSIESYQSQIELLAKLKLPEPFNDGLDLKSLFCLPDERSPIRRFPISGYIYLYVVGGWCLLVILMTFIHEFIIKRKRSKSLTHLGEVTVGKVNQMSQFSKPPVGVSIIHDVLDAVSLREAIKEFKRNKFEVKYNRGERVPLNLNGFDFFKVLMALLVILGHSAYLGQSFTRSLKNRFDLSTEEQSKLVLSVSRCVDTFFLFFGLLTSYTMMRKFDMKQLGNPLIWLSVNVGVLLRITPLFMAVYWFSKSISPYINSGPWWDYGLDNRTLKGVCISDPWWKSIIYFGSIGKPPVPTCNLPAWFLISYSQLSLLLPPITYLLCKYSNNLLRLIFTGFCLIASASIVGLRLLNQTSVREEAFSSYGGLLSNLLEKYESTGHTFTLGRLGSVSVGCLVGYWLRRYEEGQISKWPRWLCCKATLIIAALCHLAIIFLPVIGHRMNLYFGVESSLEEFALFNVLIIVVWPVLNSVVIIPLVTTYNHLATVRFFGNTFWHVFNRLGLAMYLIHWEVIFILVAGFESGPGFGHVSDVIKLWACSTTITIVFAFVVHILIEAPLSRLMMIIARSFSQPLQAQK